MLQADYIFEQVVKRDLLRRDQKKGMVKEPVMQLSGRRALQAERKKITASVKTLRYAQLLQNKEKSLQQ